MEGSVDVHSLERLFQHALESHERLAIFAALCGLYAEQARIELAARLRLKPEAESPKRDPELFNLKVGEAAKLTGMSRRWLYDHAHELPYARRHGKRSWRFSRAAIERVTKMK
jgi:predicted DNA-binding transcriptional regulator AlpA